MLNKLTHSKMKTNLVNIGFENVVLLNRIVAIVSSDTKPIKRLISECKNLKKVIDVTEGRKTRTVIVTDSDYLILSSLKPQTIVERIRIKGRLG